jgi:chemotaxis protein methyltransferase CheR
MDCVSFLQWALPRLGFRWPGFRKVRGQVCKRVRRRIAELGLDGYDAYAVQLTVDSVEWSRLDRFCRITVSRFFRDRGVFEDLAAIVLPALARTAGEEGRALRVWSVGCASGEEPYSLAVLWRLRLAADWPGVGLRLVATDSDPALLARARDARYRSGTIREFPGDWRALAFEADGGLLRLRPTFREGIDWRCQDIRREVPEGPFDLVLCRNLAFTYFLEPGQRAALARIAAVLRPGGALVLGAHETLPPHALGFEPWPGVRHCWRRVGER